ncbi:tRNA uridine-5-carboxymethylaminomethyl(34) synthesis enzyme MnmG [Deinococcus radiodurans]|jgi:glucose-inhibited division protein A|uniref:tRNA uridine 5-carboxymethylaminomethyl modification enzyme MnmG n=1 Tax=Deinococcus radiodurans (strain ATCC 13939 / DSM 20539 / JCM 16871 / CCUG 27074 / LMG 4051 / NBRC 15346 / NCIMB 9279 / VKM B-1422 / R1) TaxID=243230 RepID=MNMG_DEIRA|nr:tRNA uridine-5-carboxymethylaminomethyl(34) synthesis enzyme MnmG [Deinococcus radiodurans]Q9RYC3.1 RecName: Full=tRNA uridine 5-carboxymethylaminomethyl modification enzyme MnmG; AltName: Full=Glucose-inhibited division protein A [Deinococcus radiodurans R1 = ATCC 13939 = DSM 20539]AAF09619.1 gidA protein [Deinococcus radiodurans R1 = ATCC 13939 = DSM 20539]ANC70326.1 tRNA uridine(34) 5-carboxymethylaminomethyl synthesis enzyme MnmG [Deinococcus radiodurans R1 = ATCC 13939 = DSM 20539]QEM72
MKGWNVIVIGGGHAGLEAAWAAAKFSRVALLVGNPATVGRMPCNPAVGGPGKSQLVFEVQALGGLMGRLADDTAIHTRMLNASKGPAVQSLRVQNERDAYAERAQDVIFGHSEIEIVRGEAADLEQDGQGGWVVVTSDGRRLHARSVVLAAGTFMRGVTWYGRQSRPEGRQGEPPSRFLSAPLERGGHVLKRYKTGTPPRVRADSVRFADLLEIPADPQPRGFTGTPGPRAAESPTWQTHTTPQTHALIQENLHESPMYAGDIEGLGPRYCPSIEDKVVKFAHHDRHLLFVEPDGVQTSEVYLQGFSSSLPPRLQDELVRTLPGFEQAVIQRYAYAVEYDVVDSTELTLNLESKKLPGLFTAGQLNGTSGYEEAAAQGLVAGTAAARRSLGLDEQVIGRETSYLGVLLDDLVFKGSDEPYRMMTSRVEHRLLVRQDNADERMTPIGHALGLVDDAELIRVQEKYARVQSGIKSLSKQRMQGQTADAWLRRPELSLADVETLGATLPAELGASEREAVEIRVKYAGYIARAESQLRSEAKARELSLSGVNFAGITALSNEAREKLTRLQPQTVEQASRISGVRHADISALLVHLKGQRVGS